MTYTKLQIAVLAMLMGVLLSTLQVVAMPSQPKPVENELSVRLLPGTHNPTIIPVTSRRVCGSIVSNDRFRTSEEEFRIKKRSLLLPRAGEWPHVEIEVHWHIVDAGAEYSKGYIPREQIDRQMAVVNEDFAPANLSFKISSLSRHREPRWFYTPPKQKDERLYELILENTELEMKNKLRKGGAATVNVYTIRRAHGLLKEIEWGMRTYRFSKAVKDIRSNITIFLMQGTLTQYFASMFNSPDPQWYGWSTFPSDYTSLPVMDGILLHWSTLPGGGSVHYNLGKTLTHELGHWFGLRHTFEGESCDGEGDGVDDTPPERVASEESDGMCNEVKDSCPWDDFRDPIHNYMDYSVDVCMTEFTPGQVQRMREQFATYRHMHANQSLGARSLFL